MTSWAALTTLRVKSDAEALGLALENIIPEPTGIGVFEVEDGSNTWEVGSYFTEQPDEIALDLLAAAHGAKPFVVSEVPDKDWVAEVRRELSPITAGRFFIYGSHDADKVPADAVPLLIEAAMAFGTGHHGTTKGCLLEYERLLSAGFLPKTVLDLGCGTAVLAMAAAKTTDADIMASDIDEVATDTARANLDHNIPGRPVSVVTAAGFGHPEMIEAAPFDLIFANILKGPLIELAPDIAKNTAQNGRVILSGILDHQADETEAAFVKAGFQPDHKTLLGEWVALTVQKVA